MTVGGLPPANTLRMGCGSDEATLQRERTANCSSGSRYDEALLLICVHLR